MDNFELGPPELNGLDLSSLVPPSTGAQAPQRVSPASLRQPISAGIGQQIGQMSPMMMLLPLILKHGGASGVAAFLSGIQQHRAQQQTTQQRQFENNRQTQGDQRQAEQDQATANYRRQQLQDAFRQKVMGAANGIETPEGAKALLDFLGPEGQQLGVEPSALQSYVTSVATPTKLEQKAAQKYIGNLEKTYGQDWATKVGTATFRVPGITATDPATGQPRGLTTQELLAKSGLDMQGLPVKPAVDKPETRGLDVQAADALARGDTETYQRLLRVKKEMGLADNAPKGEPRNRFSVQQVTNADGTNGLIRVNLDTGDATPVTLPTGTGSGRASDTQRLSSAYQARTNASDLTAKKFEKLLNGLGSQIDVKLPNLLKSEAGQRYRQAKDEFINAALRRESGAAIQPSEYTRFDAIYFVQPGDTAATIAQKQEARQRVIDGFKVAAGNLSVATPTTQTPVPESRYQKYLKSKGAK